MSTVYPDASSRVAIPPELKRVENDAQLAYDAIFSDIGGLGLGYVKIDEDFLQQSSDTLPALWATQDTSAAGTPTLDFVANALNGEYKMQLATTNEAEQITLYLADHLVIDPTKKPVFICRVKVDIDPTGATAVFTAGDAIVMGLASARNATLDNVTSNIWFRIGNGLNLYVEGDDNTRDTDDVDTGFDFIENTYMWLKIDCNDLANVKFYVAGGGDPNGAWKDVTPATKINVSGLTTSTKQLTIFEVQKAAEANKDHSLVIDRVQVYWKR
jgi:hypothetical protein